ncbi:unnamed protein product [Cladocopium goreaui]|uniref:Copia protein (Gag-int-pol protein) [Cleaved into: Copia VLP protein Copia protease ] n=1 Tax=Cladocopium goreaui TaxID=2562237 RepID=A0A9P1CN06_9DINO|nr:unnamed protein product [Cladocopium goreaui]
MAPKQGQNGPGQGAASASAGGAQTGEGSQAVNTARLDNYVPTFNNVQKDYREFRKRAEIYKKKMDLGNRGSEVVYNLVTMLTGKAWDLVEDMSMEKMSAAGAYDEVFRRLDVHYMDEDDMDDVAWADDGQEYYDDGATASNHEQVFDVEEFDEIYANYAEARGKLNALRTARGFYPVVAVVEKPQNYDGGKKGKSPTRSQKGKGKSKQLPHKPKRASPDPKGRANAAGYGKKLCLRCGQPGHMARNCPTASADRKRKVDDDDAINMVETYATEGVYNLDDDDDETGEDVAVQDGGASSVLGSARQIRKYLTFLLENGFGIHEIPVFECEKGFKYGNSMKETAPRGPKGEYILHLGQDLHACRQREPDMVLMPEDIDDHIGQQVPIQTFLKESTEDVMTAVDIVDINDKEMSRHRDDAKQCNTHPAKDGIDHETEKPYGHVMRLQQHVLRKMETNLKLKVQDLDKILYTSKSLNKDSSKPHVIWEVFVGAGRTSHYLKKYDNVLVEVFSLCTGWDFEKAADRKRNIPGGGGPRSKAAESYPQALAEALANAMMVPTDGDFVMAAEDADSAGALDLAHGDLDLSPEVPQQGAVDLDLAPEPSENVTKNKALKAEVGSQVFSYVARLHKNLGHPSPEVLQRMLTEVQATSDVLKAAKEYICPKCHERKPPAGINNLNYTNGYTPAQWVLGRSSADAHSLTADLFNPGAVSMTDHTDFSHVQQKRLAAQTAFLKADTDLRLRRAMMQNYKEVKNKVVVGQPCYYWRLQGTGILQKNKWRGTCRCVAEELDDNGHQLVLWICHGTSLLRCAPHQVRPRIEDIGSEIPVDVQAALHDLQELRARSTTQFRDVIEPEAGVEDLLEEEGLDGPQHGPQQAAADGQQSEQYEPSIAPDNVAAENMETDGPSLLYQHRRRDAEEAGLELPEPSSQRPRLDSVAEPEPGPTESHSNSPADAAQPLEKRARIAINTPVPEPSDNELIVDEAYVTEIDDKSFPKDWVLIDGNFELDAVYLTNLGVRKNEASERAMTLAEKEQMIEAKQKELTSYFANKVWTFTEIGKNEADRVVTARWVLTWKKPEPQEGQPPSLQRRAKARLVLRGFEDPDLFNLEKTSPTASKSSKMLLLARVPIFGWTLFCGDVRCAFLSGAEFKRNIIVKLPRDCSALLGCQGVTYMKMNKSAYGLSDAPLLWWREADRRLRSTGLKRHKLDKCCYMLYNKNNALCVMLILHVDDLLLGANMQDPEAEALIQRLRTCFDFGKWQSLDVDKQLVYCGGHINKTEDGLSLDFEAYLKKVLPITIAKGRGKDQPLAPQETSKARGLIGALQWPAGQACLQLNASTSIIAANINKGTVDLLHELNKTLRFAKNSADLKLTMRPVCGDWSEMCLLCFSDAAVQVRADSSSQGGFVIILTNTKVLEGKSVPYSIVAWRSYKLPRVCRSSLSAEAQSCATALDELMMVKTMLALMRYHDADPRQDSTAADICSSAIVIDAKGLYDAINKDGINSSLDKRAGIEIMCIKEELVRQKTQLKWVSSERMLADGMTKIHARQALVDMLRSGYLSLVMDEKFTAAKKKDKIQREKDQPEAFQKPNSNTNLQPSGMSKVAERIATVIAFDRVTKIHAAPDTNDDSEYANNVMPDIALVITVLAILAGFYVIFCKWWCRCRRDQPDRADATTQVEAPAAADPAAEDNPAVTALNQQIAELRQDILDQLEIMDDLNHKIYALGVELDEQKASYERQMAWYEAETVVWRDQSRNAAEERNQAQIERNHYRQRARLMMNWPCWFTRHGDKWHTHRECQSLMQSDPQVREMMCRYCAQRVIDETGGLPV